MTTSVLLIRADASVAMGSGHVMRCLALAQAWQDAGGRTVFAMADVTPAIHERLTAESSGVLTLSASAGSAEDSKQTIELAQAQNAKWLVVDGYQFDAEYYQRSMKAANFKLLFLDDFGHAKHYSADVVLNQNVSAQQDLYSDCEVHTRVLLGPKYALLRREFSGWRGWKKVTSPICRRVLVLTGGSDPENLTVRVIEALRMANLEELEATVVVGGGNPHFAELQAAAVQSGIAFRFRKDVFRIADLMADADFAISAAGSTSWELCFLGLPSLLLDTAENQTRVAQSLQRRGCAIHVGDKSVSPQVLSEAIKSLAGSEELRRSLSESSQKLVDGKGASRVVSILRGIDSLVVRYANADDCRLIWELANDPEVRAASFSTEPIPWETHQLWFAQKVADEQTLLLIAQDDRGIPVGQVRFDLQGCDAELHVSLFKEKRGSGLGVPAIHAALQELFATRHCKGVHAYVKPDNIASAKLFESAGFVNVGKKIVREHSALHFIRAQSHLGIR